MRYLLILSLIFTCQFAYADDVRCYSHGRLVYHHKASDVRFVDGLMLFTEAKTDKVVFATADCIIKIEV